MPKVSVIIPVYNAKDYLERCLDSVCNQTLKDIEIICVDDCSTDNSLEILNKYADKYPQMKIIHQKVNGGESKARNTGIDNATGEYLGFVDNDDTIDLDFFEKLYNNSKNADIVKGNLKEIDYYNKIKNGQLNSKIIESGNKWHFRYEWWCAIYRRDLIKKNNIHLLEGYVLGGDCLFLHYVIEKCQKLEIVNDTYYYWHRRRESGESEILSFEKVVSALKIFDIILDNTNKMFEAKTINEDAYEVLYESCMWIPLNYIFRNDIIESKKECVKYALNFYNKCKISSICIKCIKSDYALLYKYFKSNDYDGLCAEILKYSNKISFNSKNLIAKLRLGVMNNE